MLQGRDGISFSDWHLEWGAAMNHPSDLVVRPARPGDAADLTTLAMLSKQSNGYDDAFMIACSDELRVTPSLLEAHEYWVADNCGTPCGFACLKADIKKGSGEITALFIHPAWQRRGIGRLLWRVVEQSARRKGLVALHLDADPEAEAFYRHLGFQTISRVPSGSIPGRTLPRMEISFPA